MANPTEIHFRVIFDDAGVAAKTKAAEAGFQGIGAAADRAGAQVQKFSQSNAGVSRFLQSLSLQSTDIAQQLASGQSPFTVLLQQGGQVVQQTGGLRATFSALAASVSPAALGVGFLAAGLGGVALAAFEGSREADRFTKQLILGGNAAGYTRGELDAMAKTLATATNSSVKESREAMEGLATSGAFVGETLNMAGRAALAFQRVSGKSAEEIVKDFASMKDGVGQWAVSHNRAYNFLTADQYIYIRNLEAQGRSQEAAKITLEEFAKTMETRAVVSIGLFDKAVAAAKNTWDGFVDSIKSIGRDDTIEAQIMRLEGMLRDWENINVMPRGGRPGVERELEQLRKERLRAMDGAAEQARRQQEEQKKIDNDSKGRVDARLAVDQAASGKWLQEQQNLASTWRRLWDDAWREREVTAEAYTAAIENLELQRVNAEVKAAQRSIELARARVIEKPEDKAAVDAAVIAAETRLLAVEERRAQILQKIKNNEFRVAPDAGAPSIEEMFRASDREGAGKLESFTAEQRQAANQFIRDMVDGNRRATVSMISDARQRGQAEIAIDEEILRERMALLTMNAADRQRAEEALAQWRLLREKELTQQLKPEFQRRREMWEGDFTKNDKTREGFVNGFVNAGEEGFKAWVREGKSAADVLAKYVEDKFLEIFYTRVLQKPIESFANSTFDFLGSFFTAGLFHTGGVVGGGGGGLRSVSALAFAGAPKYHTGGIAGDEVPAILRRGEEVLTANDPRHVRNGGAAAGQTIVLQSGGNNFGSDVSRPEIARYVDQRDRRLLQQVRDMMARGR